jgi:monoamine oxidase
MSRRELLQSGLATAAGLLLSASESRSNQSPGKGRKVLVVGGGFAGLACAHELASAGCHVTVLEARDRIGGRVHSFTNLVRGKSAEGGGEFIGANHPTVLSYAAKFKLEFVDVAHHPAKVPQAVVLNGRRLTREELKSARPDVNRALDLMTEACRPVLPEEPWNTPDGKSLDTLSTADWLRGLDISALSRELVAAQLTGNNGVPVEFQSHLGNLAQIRGGGIERYWTDSERYRCSGGNDQFAKKLAGAFGLERIQLNAAVTRINTEGGLARVTTVAGQVHEADDVVLCAPPSTWDRIRFDPLLPQGLRPQMGQAVKFLNAVRDHFWKRRDMGPSSMSHGGIGHTWLGTENQNATDQREVLISFISGPAARNWSKHPEHSRTADYQRELELLQPGFLESVDTTMFIDWLNTPWTNGGYSFPAPGQITTQGPIMNQGLGRLHFAGEHTCYRYVGYMEGALHSGVEAAKRVLKRDLPE